ncbi:MAG: sialate O-acetylesterase, partial [Planctomycetota bacterium]
IYGEIATRAKSFPATETVRTCQRQVAGEVANVKLVDTRDVSTKSDNTHFDTKGQIDLGKRYARAYLEMVKSAPQGGGQRGATGQAGK